jgi:ABC-type multidrug transport system ATPase subunit
MWYKGFNVAIIIELKNVSFSAQSIVIVQDFSYQFEEGKTTALVGPSGCGKSTVLKLSAGLLVPSEGEVIYRDMNVFDMNRNENIAFRKQTSMVFQDSALWANQSIFQCLELPLRVHFPKMSVKEREDRIKSVAKEVGYRRDLTIRPSQLSMGEQKLIGFARALMCRPNLFFLDEWTESLDDVASQRLIELVRSHQKEGHTIIFVSHDFRIVKNMADYVVMITEGRSFVKFTREQIEKDESLARYIEGGIAS